MSALTELSNVLWTQRRALERLLYKLEVQQLVLASGRSRWIAQAAHEVENVLERIRTTELARAVAVAGAAQELGLRHTEASLRELIDAAQSPWDGILSDHQQAFLAMTAEVDDLTRANSELLQRGYQATRDFLASLHGPTQADVYSAAGTGQVLTAPTHLVDRVF